MTDRREVDRRIGKPLQTFAAVFPHCLFQRQYCRRFRELLAIDGYYKTAEEIDAALRNHPAQAWLEGNIMKITRLN